MKKYKRFTAYIVFGILTTAVNVAVYYVCYQTLRIPNVYSAVFAWFAAVSFAFLTNKPFVFESRCWRGSAVSSEAFRFFGSRALTGAVEIILMYLLVDLLLFPGTLTKTATNIIVVLLNYAAGKYFVFAN